MEINIESKYNIGDKVFTLDEQYKYNDYYSQDRLWRVRDNTDYPLTIYQVIARATEYGLYIQYIVDNSFYDEEDVFIDLDKAKKECERRNERDGYNRE